MTGSMLSAEEKRQFHERGYIKIEKAFPEQYATEIEEAIRR